MNLALNQTWKNCLRMWKWIAGEWKKGRTNEDVGILKREWVQKHGFIGITSDCFFCEYATKRYSHDVPLCDNCPGHLVDKRFRCFATPYTHHKPIKFYRKLLQLDAKRRAKK